MPDILDPAAIRNLLDLADGDPEFVDELMDAFLGDAALQVAALRAAMATRDAGAAVRPAHTLKGMSLNMGGLRVADLARSLEELARRGALDGAPEPVAELAAAIDELAAELTAARRRRWTVA